MKKRFKDLLTILLIFLIGFPAVASFLKTGIPDTYDTYFRLSRAAKFYLAIHQGQIPPRWIGDVNHGVGDPIFNYLYPLPFVITTALHIVNFSIIDSLKIGFMLGFLFSGVTMYLFLRSMFGRIASLTGAILYMWTPSRLSHLYIAGQYEHNLSFVFVPLIFLFIRKIFQKKKLAWVLGGGAWGFLLLTHSYTSILFLPLMISYAGLLLFIYRKKGALGSFALLILAGFCLAAMIMLPNLFDRHLVQIDKNIGTMYEKNFVPLLSFFHSKWLYFKTPGELGKVQVIVFFLVIIFLLKRKLSLKKKKINKEYLYFSFFLIFWTIISSIFIIESPLARWLWKNLPLIKIVNAPYIFLAIPVFTISALTGFLTNQCFYYILGKTRRNISNLTTPFLLILISVATNISRIGVQSTVVVRDYDLYAYNGGMVAFDEFIPKTAPGEMRRENKETERERDGFFYKNDLIIPLSSETKIDFKEQKFHRINFEVESSEGDKIIIHQLFFPGWQVLIDKKPIEFTYTNKENLSLIKKERIDHGLMLFKVPKGKHQVSVLYQGTKIRRIGEMISLFTFIFLIAFSLKKIAAR